MRVVPFHVPNNQCSRMRPLGDALLQLFVEKGIITTAEYQQRVKAEIRIARAEGRERFRKPDI